MLKVLIGLLLTFALQPACAGALSAHEQARIDYLLTAVRSLEGAQFVRNNSSYSGSDAADHLAMKLRRASSSLFAPDVDQWTAEMFIDRLASESSVSGKPYLIRFSSGRERPSGEWLYEQLRHYDAGSTSSGD